MTDLEIQGLAAEPPDRIAARRTAEVQMEKTQRFVNTNKTNKLRLAGCAGALFQRRSGLKMLIFNDFS